MTAVNAHCLTDYLHEEMPNVLIAHSAFLVVQLSLSIASTAETDFIKLGTISVS